MRVVFVCSGNVCRPPTAKRLVRVIAAQSGIEGPADFALGNQGRHRPSWVICLGALKLSV